MEVCAQAQASISTERIFSRSWSGPEVMTRARISPAPVSSGSGNQPSPSMSSPVAKLQSWAKTSRSCVTTGPSKRKCVSATGDFGFSATRFWSAMFMPPVKPTVPSMTSSFLWLRRLRKGIRQGSAECMNCAAGTPRASSRRLMGEK